MSARGAEEQVGVATEQTPSIVLAAILVFAPGAAALGITWAIGWYALFSSGVLAAQAWRLHKVRAEGVTGGWAPQGAWLVHREEE